MPPPHLLLIKCWWDPQDGHIGMFHKHGSYYALTPCFKIFLWLLALAGATMSPKFLSILKCLCMWIFRVWGKGKSEASFGISIVLVFSHILICSRSVYVSCASPEDEGPDFLSATWRVRSGYSLWFTSVYFPDALQRHPRANRCRKGFDIEVSWCEPHTSRFASVFTLRSAQDFAYAVSSKDIKLAIKDRKIASILGVEGWAPLHWYTLSPFP